MLKFIRQKITEHRCQKLIDAMIFCLEKMGELNSTGQSITEEGSKKFWGYNERCEALKKELYRLIGDS